MSDLRPQPLPWPPWAVAECEKKTHEDPGRVVRAMLADILNDFYRREQRNATTVYLTMEMAILLQAHFEHLAGNDGRLPFAEWWETVETAHTLFGMKIVRSNSFAVE